MTWLERKDNWIRRGETRQDGKKKPPVLSVSQAAAALGVSRQTVFKYLCLEDPQSAVIPWQGWFRLPGGHIRIYAWAVERILMEEGA